MLLGSLFLVNGKAAQPNQELRTKNQEQKRLRLK